MRIIACDDDRHQRERLREYLSEYRDPSGEQPVVRLFDNASDLLDALEHEKYDLAILDIIMPGLSGMDAAKDIRERDQNIKLVFLTSSKEFAIESYRVRASDYILKPVEHDALFEMLNRFYSELLREKDTLSISTSKRLFSVPYSAVCFVEINVRTLTFHLSDTSTQQVSGKLSDYEGCLLSRSEFIKPHRSFVVNMDHIRTLDTKEITMRSGDVIPIARGTSKEIRDTYMNYVFSQ